MIPAQTALNAAQISSFSSTKRYAPCYRYISINKETREGTKMDNRRTHPRRSLIHHLSVTDKQTGKVIGFLDNLSLGGLMILGRDPVNFGDGGSATIELALPTDAYERGSLTLDVKSAWSLKDENADLYATGLQFVDPPAPKDINRLLEELGCSDFD
jgi:hypothetical protein